MEELRDRLLSLTRELGDVKAESAKWQGAYEALVREQNAARPIVAAPNLAVPLLPNDLGEDLYEYDKAEHDRIRKAMLIDPLGTLQREAMGTTQGTS